MRDGNQATTAPNMAQMDVRYMDTATLAPYEQNAKQHSEEQISNVAESIRRFGWKQPIVVDRDNVVIIGHCRLMAALQMGLTEVPVIVADDLTPEQTKALRIVDNKTNESPWDVDILSAELDEIDLDGFDFDFEMFGDCDSYIDSFFDQGTQTRASNPTYAVKLVFSSESEVESAIESLTSMGYDPIRL